jgi:hypothetical protein
MPGIPTPERPPTGLSCEWTATWKHALKVLKEQGTWNWETKPLLDEYVYALRAAEECREGIGWAWESYRRSVGEESQEKRYEGLAASLSSKWDVHAKRAAALANMLVLTVDSRRRNGLIEEVEVDAGSGDPFDEFSASDELAARRARGAS